MVKMLAMSVLTGRQRFRKKVRDYNHERDTHTVYIPEDPPKGGITQRGAVIFLVRMYAPTFRFFCRLLIRCSSHITVPLRVCVCLIKLHRFVRCPGLAWPDLPVDKERWIKLKNKTRKPFLTRKVKGNWLS